MFFGVKIAFVDLFHVAFVLVSRVVLLLLLACDSIRFIHRSQLSTTKNERFPYTRNNLFQTAPWPILPLKPSKGFSNLKSPWMMILSACRRFHCSKLNVVLPKKAAVVVSSVPDMNPHLIWATFWRLPSKWKTQLLSLPLNGLLSIVGMRVTTTVSLLLPRNVTAEAWYDVTVPPTFPPW